MRDYFERAAHAALRGALIGAAAGRALRTVAVWRPLAEPVAQRGFFIIGVAVFA